MNDTGDVTLTRFCQEYHTIFFAMANHYKVRMAVLGDMI